MPSTKARRPWRWIAGAAVAALALRALLTLPMATKQGINFNVSSHQIPLYVKALDFLYRDAHYRLLAKQITAGCRTETERVLAVFAWTKRNIRETPKGWPIVDDHILDIIIRGHGLSDQVADVFTTLCTYAGVPGFWRVIGIPGSDRDVILSFARVDGRWVALDVWRGWVCARPDGRLVDVEELAADPALIRGVIGQGWDGSAPYEAYVARAVPLSVPRPLRPELQMTGRRLWYEARRSLGMEHPHGS